MNLTTHCIYLAERLQSARGLGWEMPLDPPLQKGGRGDSTHVRQGNPPQIRPNPPSAEGRAGVLLRWMGLVRG